MKEKISQILVKFTDLKKEEILNLIEVPPSPELGDYAFPCFVLAKKFKKNPNEIAEELADKILQKKDQRKEIEKIQPIGPYLNFFINQEILAENTLKEILAKKDKYGSQNNKQKIIIESPGPNTNKPLHIGHVRNIVLAQSLQQILKFSGNDVKLVDIINDRGAHICKSMIAYQKFGKGNSPEKAKQKPDHFVGDYYVKFAKEAEKNPALKEEVQLCLEKWEAGDKDVLALWKKMNDWALKGLRETYKKLNLVIDRSYYESEIYKGGKKIILDALKNGYAKRKQDGAVFVDLGNPLGEKILLRANGTSVYITQDIYLAVLRKKESNFDRAIYVVANEQDYHFKVLFKILKELGYNWADKLYHLSYGMVNLESGKMKSREGNVIDADDLIEEIKALTLHEIENRYKNLSKKEKEKRANAILFAAIRYYLLKIDKTKDILFMPEAAISFEGNTGPYLLYSYARAKSILRKANYKKSAYKVSDVTDKEKLLIKTIANFSEVVSQAYQNLAPNLITNYAHQLCQQFNELYHSEKIIGSENQDFKLALVSAFSQVLKNSLALLKIETLEEM